MPWVGARPIVRRCPVRQLQGRLVLRERIEVPQRRHPSIENIELFRTFAPVLITVDHNILNIRSLPTRGASPTATGQLFGSCVHSFSTFLDLSVPGKPSEASIVRKILRSLRIDLRQHSEADRFETLKVLLAPGLHQRYPLSLTRSFSNPLKLRILGGR